MMIAVAAKGQIDTIAGSYYFVRRINTGLGKSFLQKLFSRKDLFIGTPTSTRYYYGDFVHERLQLLEPVRPFVIRNFPQPEEILVESLE